MNRNLVEYILDIGWPGVLLISSTILCILINRKGISTKSVYWIPLFIGFSIYGYLRHLSLYQSISPGLDMDRVAAATAARAELIVAFSSLLAITTFVCCKSTKINTQQ
jgi:hypothetical protein